MDAQSPIILVVGGAGVGKKALIARIVRSGSTGSPSLPFSWKIDTKYYIAEARFDAARYSAAEETQQAEALILTVDATDQQGYEAAKAWHADRSHVECEVCLMVVNKMDLLSGSDGSLQRSAWHQDAQDWCCENYFEYIEVSAASTTVDQSLEDQGVRRVIGALHAHTWPGLRMKESGNGAPAGSNGMANASDTVRLSNRVGTASSTAHGHHDVVHANDPSPASGSSPAVSQEPQDRQAAPASSGGTAAAGTEEQAQARQENGVGGVTESGDDLEDIDRLLGSLSAMRRQLQALPDGERRARAEDMAMQMLATFGVDDDDSDEEG